MQLQHRHRHPHLHAIVAVIITLALTAAPRHCRASVRGIDEMPTVERRECETLFDDWSNGTLYESLTSKSTTPLPVTDQVNDLSIFINLVHTAGLEPMLSKPASRLTLFLPDDSSLYQTARDLRAHLRLYNLPLNNLHDSFAVIVEHFITQYEDPIGVLQAIIRSHLIRTEIEFCEFWKGRSWVTLSQQRLVRSGTRIESVHSQFISPELSIQYLPAVTSNGNIIRIDRMVLPDLSAFPMRRANVSPSPAPSPSTSAVAAPILEPQPEPQPESAAFMGPVASPDLDVELDASPA